MRNRTVTLYHVAHENNWYSIVERGLLTRLARGRIPAIWLVTKTNRSWAIDHVCKMHPGWTKESLVIFEVAVRRSNLKKTKMRGVWYCMSDIQPNGIKDCEVAF